MKKQAAAPAVSAAKRFASRMLRTLDLRTQSTEGRDFCTLFVLRYPLELDGDLVAAAEIGD
jgi:hypothetical protein